MTDGRDVVAFVWNSFVNGITGSNSSVKQTLVAQVLSDFFFFLYELHLPLFMVFTSLCTISVLDSSLGRVQDFLKVGSGGLGSVLD